MVLFYNRIIIKKQMSMLRFITQGPVTPAFPLILELHKNYITYLM